MAGACCRGACSPPGTPHRPARPGGTSEMSLARWPRGCRGPPLPRRGAAAGKAAERPPSPGGRGRGACSPPGTPQRPARPGGASEMSLARWPRGCRGPPLPCRGAAAGKGAEEL